VRCQVPRQRFAPSYPRLRAEHVFRQDHSSTHTVTKTRVHRLKIRCRRWERRGFGGGTTTNCKVSLRLGGEIRLGGGRAKSSPASIWLVHQYVRAWAAKCGLLDILQRAHNHGCSWNEWICRAAAAKWPFGRLDLGSTTRQHGCAWDEYTCRAAANHGH
jgi:hypothetical protein